MTGLPILTTTVHIPRTTQLGPTQHIPASYTDDSDTSTSTGPSPPPLEDYQSQIETNGDVVTSDSSNTSHTLDTSSTSCSQSSASDPDPPKPSEIDDEQTNTQTYEQPITGPTKCIICSQTSIQQ